MRYIPDFFKDNPGMFIHNLQIITNFLFVCQSFSWLTSLMKLGQYRDISCPGQDIFLKTFGGNPGMFLHYFKIITNFLYVCQSFSWLTSLFYFDTMKMKAWKKPFKGIFSSAFAHLANAEPYILLPSLTYLLPHILTNLLTDLLQKKI